MRAVSARYSSSEVPRSEQLRAADNLQDCRPLTKLLSAASAWWGITSAADRQRIDGLVRRAVRTGTGLYRT